MSRISGAADSTAENPLPLRVRPDLKIQHQVLRQASRWVVHDPVALRTYQLGEHERFILERIGGRTSLASIQRAFDQQFAPRRLDLLELQSFLAMMHREGLIQADTEGQGTRLLVRRDELLTRKRWSRALNLLAIRFPGVNPSPLLTRLEPWTRWLYRPAILFASVAVGFYAALIVFGATVRGELPEIDALLNWQSAAYVLLAIGFAKIVHELAHALTCVHFGGRCQEIGLMLLVFTPCLYCDVSSSVMFPSKWKRIAVSAAGMAVELLIASISIVVWSQSEPGSLHDFCFALAVVCSVNTLLINGNPLLRFDGYYILADVVEVPNLQSLASQQLRSALGRFFTDAEDRPLARSPEISPIVLLVYGVSAFVYRVMILIGIVWMSYVFLGRNHLVPLAHLLAAIIVMNALIVPQFGTMKQLASPSVRRRVRWWRAAVGGATITLAMIVVLFVPWPHHLFLTAVVHAADAERIYVTVPGIVTQCVGEGESVAAGETLAQLANLQLDMQVAELRTQRFEQQQHVDALRRTQGSNERAAEQLPTAITALAELERRLDRRVADHEELTLRSSIAGIVLAAQQADAPSPVDELDRVDGPPTDPRNLYRYLEIGTLLCQVGDPQEQETVATVPARDVSLLERGQTATVRFRQWPGVLLSGRVMQISAMQVSPHARADTVPSSDSGPRHDQVDQTPSLQYKVRIQLDDGHPLLRLGTQGTARVNVRSRSLAARAWNYLRSRLALGL